MPHNLAHLLYELRRKAGHSDFQTEERITVIRQINTAIELGNITIQTQLRGPAYFCNDNGVRRNFCLNPSFEHDLTGWIAIASTVGKAAQLTAGNSESLSIADNPSVSTGDINFVCAVWGYLDSIGIDRHLAAKFQTTGNNREWRLFYDHSSLRFRFEVSATGSNIVVNVDADSLGAPAINTFYFIVVWHDSVADTINIQVDDGTVDSANHTGGLTDLTSAFEIGSVSGGTGHWDGRAVAAAFWKDRTLTAAERTFLRNGGDGRAYEALGLLDAGEFLKTGLISYWNLSEASGTRIDSHGTNNLTDNNTVTQAVGLADFGANARDSAQSNSGENSLKLAMVNSAASAEVISQRFVHTGLASGEVWSISVSVRIAALTLAKFTLRLEFLDSGDVVQATHNVDSTTVSTSFATVANDNRTAPATTTKLRATLILQSTAALAFGSIHCDSLLIEKAAAAGSYFDGDSQDSFWEVAIHNGESFNDVDGTAIIAGNWKT